VLMKRENWFFTPIWIDHLNINCSDIANECLELKNNNYPNRIFTNRGGWQSRDLNVQDLKSFGTIKSEIEHRCDKMQDLKSFGTIKSEIEHRCDKIAKEIEDGLRLELDNIWININQRGDYNEKHVHPSSAFSGVIYIQTDENTGNIRFFDDLFLQKHYPLKLSEKNNFFHHAIFYKPVNGMMMIFPSWTSHDVLPSDGDLTRISISFNIKQV